MYGRLTIIQARPEDRAKMEAVADRTAPTLRGLKGFREVKFFLDEKAGVYGSFSFWESKEDADAAGGAMNARVQQVAADLGLREPPRIMTVEIYEPKA
jgi:heme-degrading monooxygenase HmoA